MFKKFPGSFFASFSEIKFVYNDFKGALLDFYIVPNLYSSLVLNLYLLIYYSLFIIVKSRNKTLTMYKPMKRDEINKMNEMSYKNLLGWYIG